MLLKGSTLLFSMVTAVIVMLAADEYRNMADRRAVSVPERLLIDFLLALPLLVTCLTPELNTLPFGVFLAIAGCTVYLLFRYKYLAEPYDLYTRLVFGSLYVGFLGSHLILLRFYQDGAAWLIVASAVTACSDTGAYVVGRTWGRRKLCPDISPNKTLEGAAGGVIAGTLGGLLFSLLLLPSVNVVFIIVAAVILTVTGIIGDLTESIVKRGTGTKDSGKCLGGHGGILDRVDSLLFVGPLFYYLLVFWM